MGRPYIPNPADVAADFPTDIFEPWPLLDRGTDHPQRVETFVWPGASHNYTMRLDMAIMEQVTLSIQSNGSPLLPVRWSDAPGPGEVAVNFAAGLVRGHSSVAGTTGSAGYKPVGSVIDAQWQAIIQEELRATQEVASASVSEEQLQTAIESHTHDATALVSGTLPNGRLSSTVARTNTAQTWTAVQSLPALLSRLVLPLTNTAYATGGNTAANISVNDVWVQYWRPSSYTCQLNLPALSSVADGHTMFLLGIGGVGNSVLKANGTENIDFPGVGLSNTQSLSASPYTLYICRSDSVSNRWRLIQLN